MPEVPLYAYEPDRAQYRASLIVDKLAESMDGKEEKILGVTGEDLFEQGLNYVFGEASPAHGAAVISLCRLSQEFNGDLPDPGLLIDRPRHPDSVGHPFTVRADFCGSACFDSHHIFGSEYLAGSGARHCHHQNESDKND